MKVVGLMRAWVRALWIAVALVTGLSAVAAASGQAAAAATPAGSRDAVDAASAFMATLTPRTGDVKLPNGIITLHLGTRYYYLAPADAERVLVEAWGNPPGNETQGMIFPANARPTDNASWGIVLTYVEDGYVDDTDAGEIDYADLLQKMQEETIGMNDQRKADGFPAMQLVGWAEPPHYDADRRALHWAKVLRVEGAAGDTLNYNVRTLGRRGVLEMNFVADAGQLPEIKRHIDAVLAVPAYEPGHRYIDFDPDVDEVAAYGLGALVAGKVAGKLGLLAGGLLLLKKFWFVIVGVGAWIFSRVRWRAARAAARSAASGAGASPPSPPSPPAAG